MGNFDSQYIHGFDLGDAYIKSIKRGYLSEESSYTDEESSLSEDYFEYKAAAYYKDGTTSGGSITNPSNIFPHSIDRPYEEMTFAWDDSGVPGGSNHRTWSACEIAVAHMSRHYFVGDNMVLTFDGAADAPLSQTAGTGRVISSRGSWIRDIWINEVKIYEDPFIYGVGGSWATAIPLPIVLGKTRLRIYDATLAGGFLLMFLPAEWENTGE
jgi:hypothetical protein